MTWNTKWRPIGAMNPVNIEALGRVLGEVWDEAAESDGPAVDVLARLLASRGVLAQGPLAERERFWSKVEKSDGCWRWTGTILSTGYGSLGVRVAGKWTIKLAHRLCYEYVVGPIPAGLHLDHLCRNRGCVNPAHLEPVTPRENNLRGTSPMAVNARKTHCKNGHELTGANVRVLPSRPNGRACVECGRQRWREWSAKPEVKKRLRASQRAWYERNKVKRASA